MNFKKEWKYVTFSSNEVELRKVCYTILRVSKGFQTKGVVELTE